jgi:hypothetical protein
MSRVPSTSRAEASTDNRRAAHRRSGEERDHLVRTNAGVGATERDELRGEPAIEKEQGQEIAGSRRPCLGEAAQDSRGGSALPGRERGFERIGDRQLANIDRRFDPEDRNLSDRSEAVLDERIVQVGFEPRTESATPGANDRGDLAQARDIDFEPIAE